MNTNAAIDACWSGIGVRGDGSCAQLAVHVHCRNCPVYSAAARVLLDAPFPARELAAATRHFAQDAAGDSSARPSAQTQSVIIFRLRGEWFALPTVLCLEVADVRPIHSLPHRRNGAVLGIVSVRGELLVCLSLADILGAAARVESAQQRSGTARLLVARRSAGAVVFPVDEVHGVQRVRLQDTKEIPATVAKAQSKYTRALLSLDRKTAGLIDDELLFHTVERSLA